MKIHGVNGKKGRLVRALAMLATVVSVGVLPGVPASAKLATKALGGPTATVSGCLSGHDGPSEEVASWNNRFHLFCGDHTKGILHIDDDHPITNSGQFLNCLDKVFLRGRQNGPGNVPGSHVWKVDYRVGMGFAQAYGLVRDSDGYVLTAYPVNPHTGDSTNWAQCNAGEVV